MTPWRIVVPNFFTAISLLVGGAAILFALNGELTWAAWMILWGVLLDKADGTAARLLNAVSRFGSQFDSMSDLVTFGIAPAVLSYAAVRAQYSAGALAGPMVGVTVAAAFYALCAAIRLARFNAESHSEIHHAFLGVPTTLAGALVASGWLVLGKHGLLPLLSPYFPVVLLALGLGMVSRLRVPKVIRRKSPVGNAVQLVIIALTYVFGFGMILPEYHCALAFFYLTIGSQLKASRSPLTEG